MALLNQVLLSLIVTNAQYAKALEVYNAILVKKEDFVIDKSMPEVRTQVLCQTQAHLHGYKNYALEVGSNICQLGTVKASLPRIANEPDQITVWSGDESFLRQKVPHVMVFGPKTDGSFVTDHSFDGNVSRTLSSLEVWSESNQTAFLAYWKYRSGVLYCEEQDCFFKPINVKESMPYNKLVTERFEARAFGRLNGLPWIAGGTDRSGTALYSSEILEPSGKWVQGPVLPNDATILGTCCLQDLENGKIMLAGFGWDYTFFYDIESGEWSKNEDFKDAIGWSLYKDTTCTKVTRGTSGDRFVVMVGGISNGNYKLSLTNLYNIETDKWTQGPEVPFDDFHRGTFVGPETGLDGVYLLGGNIKWTIRDKTRVTRLRDDLSGWDDLNGEWEFHIRNAMVPIPLVYT